MYSFRFNVYFFVLSILIYSIALYAQAPDTMWTKTIGGSEEDGGYSVQQTADGGYIITGYTNSFGAGGSDIWLIKTDSSGDTLWTRTFGGSSDEEGRSVQQTTDGGYIIIGTTESFGMGSKNIWLIKTDALGDTLWTKIFRGDEDDLGYFVQQTADSGYIITGETFSYDLGNKSDIWLIKTDPLGDTLWTKTYGEDFRNEEGRSIQQTTDGGYIITGSAESHVSASYYLPLIKTDAFGNTLWTKNFDEYLDEVGRSVQQTTDGGYIITGYTVPIFHASDYVEVIKTDSLGESQWKKFYGGDLFLNRGSEVQQTTDGGYIVIGYTAAFGAGGYDAWLLKINALGDTVWTKAIGRNNDDGGYSVKQTTDEGYIITGYTIPNGEPSDIWLIKTAADITDVKQRNDLEVTDFALHQNYPNPFNPATNIRYEIPSTNFVTLKVYDLLGNELTTLVNEEKQAGEYKLTWSAANLSSGVYYYQIRAGGFVETKKMILIR